MQTTFGLKRAGNRNTAISSGVVDAVFQTAKNAAGIAEGNSAAEWIVFRVTDITVSDFDAASPEVKRITDQMRRSLTEDMLAQYVQRLRTDIGATVNLEALRRVVVGQHRPELMQIEPSPEAFAARYARGEPQVVWTTLVADLETPVSAFLKLAGGRAEQLPARIGRRRRGARPLLDDRAGAGSDLARRRHARGDQPRGAHQARTRLRPAPSRRSLRCAR